MVLAVMTIMLSLWLMLLVMAMLIIMATGLSMLINIVIITIFIGVSSFRRIVHGLDLVLPSNIILLLINCCQTIQMRRLVILISAERINKVTPRNLGWKRGDSDCEVLSIVIAGSAALVTRLLRYVACWILATRKTAFPQTMRQVNDTRP